MRTASEVVGRGCRECRRNLHPDDAVLAVASYALVSAEAEDPVRWSRGTIVALCEDCAASVPQQDQRQGGGSYFASGGDE